MKESSLVVVRIITVFVLILAGWRFQRKNLLSPGALSALSRLVMNVCLPCLLFHQMLLTVNPESWEMDRLLLVLGAVMMLTGYAFGWVCGRVAGVTVNVATFAFLIGQPNSLYLPLPIAQELFGGEGTKAVLLENTSVYLMIFTVGFAILQGSPFRKEAWKAAFTNAALWTAIAGIAVALISPEARRLASLGGQTPQTLIEYIARAVVDSLVMLGGMTVPLSMVLTGAQMGGIEIQSQRPNRQVLSVSLLKLLAVPLVTLLVVRGLVLCGVQIPRSYQLITCLLSAMPVAVSSTVYVERFNGDADFTAQCTFYSTILSLITVPVLYLVLTTLVF